MLYWVISYLSNDIKLEDFLHKVNETDSDTKKYANQILGLLGYELILDNDGDAIDVVKKITNGV